MQVYYESNNLCDQKELLNSKLSRQLLKKHNYDPKPLYSENGSLIDIHDFFDYGIDDILYTKDIPQDDVLNLKRMQPINKDGVYYSVDYRSNNFGIMNRDNDNFIFVKLTQVIRFLYKPLTKEVLLEKQRAGVDIRIRGILSNENPDYHFYIRHNGNMIREGMSENSLINAYLVPVKSLREHVIYNLNQIRTESNKSVLDFKSTINSIVGMDETWNLYKEEDPEDYDFEIIRMKDFSNNGKFDLMMKINPETLKTYIKFDERGNIKKHIP